MGCSGSCRRTDTSRRPCRGAQRPTTPAHPRSTLPSAITTSDPSAASRGSETHSRGWLGRRSAPKRLLPADYVLPEGEEPIP